MADPHSMVFLMHTEVVAYPQMYRLLEFSFGGRKEILHCVVNFKVVMCLLTTYVQNLILNYYFFCRDTVINEEG